MIEGQSRWVLAERGSHKKPPSCPKEGTLALEYNGAAGDNYKLVLDLEVSASKQWDGAHPGEATSEGLASRNKFPWETLQEA